MPGWCATHTIPFLCLKSEADSFARAPALAQFPYFTTSTFLFHFRQNDVKTESYVSNSFLTAQSVGAVNMYLVLPL